MAQIDVTFIQAVQFEKFGKCKSQTLEIFKKYSNWDNRKPAEIGRCKEMENTNTKFVFKNFNFLMLDILNPDNHLPSLNIL